VKRVCVQQTHTRPGTRVGASRWNWFLGRMALQWVMAGKSDFGCPAVGKAFISHTAVELNPTTALCLQFTSPIAIEMSCIRSPFQAGVRLSSRSRTQILSTSRAFSTVQDTPTFSTPIPPVVTRQSSPLQDAVNASGPRMDWEKEEISRIYNSPLIELQYAAVSHLSTNLRLEPKHCLRFRYPFESLMTIFRKQAV